MYERVEGDEAVRVLVEESGIGEKASDAALEEIAALLDGERPALRWAAGIARTTGFKPLQPKLVGWTFSTAKLPWREEIERAVAALAPADAQLLALLAACDAAFAWDLLEDVAPDVAVESVVALEEAKLLVRSAREGSVTFFVPFTVRAIVRDASQASRWLDAWTRRAEQLRTATYGVASRVTLAELAAAIPLAMRALANADPPAKNAAPGPNAAAPSAAAPSAAQGLALWLAASDALFFGGVVAFDAPAFDRAVAVADALGNASTDGNAHGGALADAGARARVIAARARLERGSPAAAIALLREAETESADVRAEIERGVGWAALALADFDLAKAAFDAAREATAEPRTQADAAAGLGIRALMNGEAAAARAFLEESLAIHVVMRDAPREASVRGMMELLPSAASAASAAPGDLTGDVEKFRANGQRWREALALARLALAARARGDADAERLRLFEARAAAGLAQVPAASNVVRTLVEPAPPSARAATMAKPVVVGVDGRSLALPNGDIHDFARHGPVRRILWALANARLERPGTATSTLAIIDAGWPGEKMKHEAATLRVYTTIRRLRSFGLGDVLVTRDDGYLLDPDVPLVLGP